VTKAEEYRRKAEAERSAEQVKDAGAKRIYREIAERWRDLAAHEERHGP
jgi:hypothetical protein